MQRSARPPQPSRRPAGRLAVRLAGAALAAALVWPAPVAGRGETGQSMERTQIEIDGLVFDALVAGPEDGPLVFLLHGFPQSSFEWRHQIPVLAAMGMRVVAPDQRGYSPGARPEGVEPYAVPELVGDVIGMADVLGAATFHVVGHDWGAAVAWFTALGHPERVESLVAVSVPHPFAFAQAAADPNGEQAGMSSYMETFRSEGAEDLLVANDAAALRAIYAGAGLSAVEIQRYVDVLGTPEAMRAALNWYRAMTLPTPPGPVTPIRMPTMYVWSTADMALGRTGAELTENFVEGPYRFEVLEGVSHWVPEEAADELNRLLREHFTAHAR